MRQFGGCFATLEQIVRSVAVSVMISVCGLGLVGCSTSTGSEGGIDRTPSETTPTVRVERFNAPEPPADFDASRARLSLADIPGDPAAPKAAEPTEPTEPVELPKRALRYLKEARRLLSEQRYSETISESEKALRYDPNLAEAHRLMSLASLWAGNQQLAEAYASRAVDLVPDDLVGHYVLGRVALVDTDRAKALMMFRTALKCPDDAGPQYRPVVHYYLGNLLYEEHYYAAAAAQLKAFVVATEALDEEQLQSNPELATLARVQRPAMIVRMVRAYMLLNEHAEAAKALGDAVANDPDNTALREAWIESLVRMGDTKEAEVQADRFVKDTNGSQRSVELLLDVYRHAGQIERGVAAIKTIVERQPDNVELWLLYVDALVAVKDFDEAANTLKSLKAKHPDDDNIRWKTLAMARQRGEWSEWIIALADELVRSPEDDQRGVAELSQVDDKIAEQIVADADAIMQKIEAAKLTPDTIAPTRAAARCLLGRLCDRLDRLADARTFYGQALEHEKSFLPSVVALSELYVSRNRWNDALTILKADAAERETPVAVLERLMGQCYDGLDDIDEAVKHYEKATQLRHSGVSAIMALAKLYDRTGQLDKAHRQLQSAIAADAELLEPREMLIRIKLQQLDRGDDPEKVQQRQAAVLSELADMKRLAPNAMATLRCNVLCAYRFDGRFSSDSYAKQLRELVKQQPDDMRTRFDLASAFVFLLLEHANAEEQIDKLLEADPYRAEYNELKAIVLAKQLRFAEAAAQSNRMLEWFPNRKMWIRSLAEVYLAQQDYDGAAAAWQRLADMAEKTEERLGYQRVIVGTMLAGKQYDKAHEMVEAWILSEKDDETQESYQELMLDVYKGSKDYDSYLAQCRQWKPSKANERKAEARLVDALMLSERYDEAFALLLSGLEASGGGSSQLQQRLIQAERFDDAIELATSELAAATEFRERYINMDWLARVYAAAGQHDNEIETRRQIVASLPKEVGESFMIASKSDLATALTRGKEYDEAIKLLNSLIDAVTNESLKLRLVRQLGSVHQYQHRLDLSEARLREALEYAPRDAGINNDLGYTLADAGKDMAEAERMVRLAVGEEPRNAAFLDSIGWVMYKKGDFAAAKLWLGRAVNLEDGQDPVVFDHMGDTYWRFGDHDKAVASWTESLKLHAEYVEQGRSDADDPIVGTVQAKLDAVAAGQTPKVAEPVTVSEDDAPDDSKK